MIEHMLTEEMIRAIDAEPELPGEIPDEMWYQLKVFVDSNARGEMAEALRVIVRETKRGIKERILRGGA